MLGLLVGRRSNWIDGDAAMTMAVIGIEAFVNNFSDMDKFKAISQ